MINDEIGTAPNLNDSKSKPLNIAKITSHRKNYISSQTQLYKPI